MKSKVFSFINVFGLTAGLSVCLMIFLFVMNELSVDRFHTNGKSIYRVVGIASCRDPCSEALASRDEGDVELPLRYGCGGPVR